MGRDATANEITFHLIVDFPGGSDGKASACNTGDPGSILGLGRSPGEEKATHSSILALENSMDRGAWRAAVHEVTKSQA